MEAPKEKSEGMTSGINQISKMGLARELGASPMNFSEQRKGFESWFKKTITIERGVKILGDGEEETRMTIVPNQNIFFQIPDGHLLFLYLTKIPLEIESIEEWKLFLGYYTHLFHNQGLLRMREIIQNNPDDLLDQLADNEVRYIMVNLFNIGKFDGKLPDDMMKRLRETSGVIEPDFRENRETWGKKRGVGALFARNIVARERPEHDITYLDEFLCYFDGLFFRSIVTNCLLKNVPLFQSWITARSDLLADTSTQTYKLFCQIFYLSEEGMFDDEGTINVQALIKIPTDFHDALFYVERRRKERIIEERKAQEVLLEKQKNLEEKRALEEKTRNHIAAILAEKLTGLCDSDFIISLQNIPPIEKIFVTIRRGKKAIARTSCNPQDMPLDLKQCTFEVFDVAAKNTRATWENISQWKGGETYSIEVEGRIDTQGGLPTTIHTWKGEKRHRERTKREEPAHIPWRPTVVPATPGKVETILNSAPTHTPKTSLQAADPEIPKDPKESEKEDLEVALELLLLEKSPEALQSLFVENTLWNKEKKTLTITLPISELEEMGYIPSVLLASDYGPMTQWTVRKEKNVWVPEGKEAPEIIRTYYECIYLSLSQNIERGEIDNYLSECGLSPSETSDNSALRGAIQIGENIDIKNLLIGITKMSEKYIQDGAPYNIYSGPPAKDGTPTSISWLSKKQWRATLTLQPTIRIDLTPTNNQAVPYNASLMSQRIENALLNFVYQFMKSEKGISGIIKRTSAQENTKKLREYYRRELKKKTARLLVENADGTFTIIEGISIEGLADAIRNAQLKYGKENVALLYRRSTYTFPGDTSICKPSQSRSDDDYISLNLPERRNIIKERILKTLFNGKSGVQDRAPFRYGSAVYHALQFQVQAFQEKSSTPITRDDITEEFQDKFIQKLRSEQVLISYRDYCAGEVEDLTDLVAA